MAVGRNLTFKQFVAEQCMKSNSFDYPGERIIFFNKDCVEAWRLPDDLDPEYAAEAIVKGWLETQAKRARTDVGTIHAGAKHEKQHV